MIHALPALFLSFPAVFFFTLPMPCCACGPVDLCVVNFFDSLFLMHFGITVEMVQIENCIFGYRLPQWDVIPRVSTGYRPPTITSLYGDGHNSIVGRN